jgi:ADP-heptose:LPS heptosyltransferase
MHEKTKFSMIIERILIVELWGIGDLVIMSSILKPLRKAFPNAEITLLSKETSSHLFKYDSTLDEMVFFDFPWTAFKNKYFFWQWDFKGITRVIKKLREKKFDLILDARSDIRNQILTFLIKGRKNIGYSWKRCSLFLSHTIGDYANKHKVEAWHALLHHLDIQTTHAEPTLVLSDDEKVWASDFLRQRNVNSQDLVVGIHPGARIKTRCWPLERFAEVTEYIQQKYRAKIIIFIEPGGYGNDIPIRGEFLQAQVSLRQMIALIDKLGCLICNDGGPMHIASSLHIPTIAIFGPTESKWFKPWGTQHIIVQKDGVTCRPCFDYCKHNEPFCITGISVKEVLQQADIQLGSRQK